MIVYKLGSKDNRLYNLAMDWILLEQIIKTMAKRAGAKHDLMNHARWIWFDDCIWDDDEKPFYAPDGIACKRVTFLVGKDWRKAYDVSHKFEALMADGFSRKLYVRYVQVDHLDQYGKVNVYSGWWKVECFVPSEALLIL